MTNIKKKIEEIKLARMGPEYRFVADVFANLEPHTTGTKLHHIYFLKDGIPILIYDKKANYLWCHHDLVWEPLLKIIDNKLLLDDASHREEIKEMRKIVGHFALAYFDMSDTTISMAHTFITDSWKKLKFKRVYVW